MKSFHEMTADEIAEHREKWRKGEAEIWTCTTARRSVVDPKRTILSDHEAPTLALCALASSRAIGDCCSWVVTNPMKVLPVVFEDERDAMTEEEHRRLDEVEAEYLRDRRRGPGDA